MTTKPGQNTDPDYDPNNIFAKILRGEAPAHRVYEDDHALAFMDVMPQTAGHTLVIPKDPTTNIFYADPSILGHTVQVVQRVAKAVQHVFDTPGTMIMQLNGRAAGQTVFHLHFHIVPRSEGIELRLHAQQMADPESLASHAQQLREALALQ